MELEKAVTEVPKEAPGYWDIVSARVGKDPEECKRQQLGGSKLDQLRSVAATLRREREQRDAQQQRRKRARHLQEQQPRSSGGCENKETPSLSTTATVTTVSPKLPGSGQADSTPEKDTSNGRSVSRQLDFATRTSSRQEQPLMPGTAPSLTVVASVPPSERKMSVAPLPAAGQAIVQVEALPEQADIVLTRWSVELVRQPGSHAVALVRGVRHDGENFDIKAPKLWRTAEVARAMSPTILITRTQLVVQLVGPMSKKLSLRLQLPQWLEPHFRHGFPLQTWALLVKYAGFLPTTIGSDVCSASHSQASNPHQIAPESEPTECEKVPEHAHDLPHAQSSASDFDWIGSLQEIPDSTSRQATRPSLRVDEAAKGLVDEAFRQLSNTQCAAQGAVDTEASAKPLIVTSMTPLLVAGSRVRRIFRDGWFSAKIAAFGANDQGGVAALLAYDDGFWELLPMEDLHTLSRRKRLRTAAPDGSFSDGDGDIVRKRPCRRLYGKQQPTRSSQAKWSKADEAALQTALREVRPDAAQFWQRVSDIVGKSAEECQSHSFKQRVDKLDSAAGKARAHRGDKPAVAPVRLPVHDGPRRQKGVRQFIQAQSFGDGRDFLQQPSAAHKAAAAPKTEPAPCMPIGSSPGSLKFLSSLHTGCTPDAKQAKSLVRQLFAMSPGAPQEGWASKSPGDLGAGLRDLRDEAVWHPVGLDSFICDARSRRNQAGKCAKVDKADKAEVLMESDALSKDIRQAPDLFRKLDAAVEKNVNRDEMCEEEPPSESEDEAAPVASIPPYVAAKAGA